MKALSLWQPWAQLVVMLIKRIETRSWSTNYRGPLAIHAAKRRLRETDFVDDLHAIESAFHANGMCIVDDLPLGMIIATCTLVDVIPMVDRHDLTRLLPDGPPYLHVPDMVIVNGPRDGVDVRDQQPFGDFRPGRHAWILDDITPLPEPVAAVGRQGLWTWAA